MIEGLPVYIPFVFLATTLLTVWFLFSAAKEAGRDCWAGKIFHFLVPFWLLLTGYLATSDFYREFSVLPPRVAAFAVMPAILFIAIYFIFFRGFLSDFSLRWLTILHLVRVPVEIVLFWLFLAGQVPVLMTFEGWNYDILSGLTAPIVYWLAFRNGKVNRALLIVWNLFALALLVNIVSIAVLSFKSPMQKLAFDQPNVGVTYLPFIWLPALVVPAVLFSHLVALYKLLANDRSGSNT